MAIVKLQNGNVLLKDGKVSCSCCAPVGCCMYSAQALVDGAYTYEDLPDAIDVAGVVFTKLNPPESVAGFTRYYVNANDEYLGILDGEEESLWSYEGGGGPCLINGYNGQGGEREDQFADSYLVEMQMFNDYVRGSCIVTRTGVGTWEGTAYGVGAGSWVPSTPLFDDASVDMYVTLTLCDSNVWQLKYEPFAYHCVNLNPTWPGDCQSAIGSTGPGPFLNNTHQKWSVDIGAPGQYQSSPDQGSGMYQDSGYFDTNLYNGLPLFGSKVS